MDNKQARKTGRTIAACGCVFLVLTNIPLGVTLIVIGLLISVVFGRCPHCGKFLIGLSARTTSCPRCHGRL